jgi:hypothetical protein
VCNLLATFQRIDVSIAKLQEKAILLVGPPKGAKSATFNWMTSKPMLGKQGSFNTCFVASSPDSSTAAMSQGYVPETLVPNVCPDFRPGVSLVDTISFSHYDDPIRTVARPYCMTAIFEKVKEVKFLMVVREDWLTDETGYWLHRAFDAFIELFDFVSLTAEMKD